MTFQRKKYKHKPVPFNREVGIYRCKKCGMLGLTKFLSEAVNCPFAKIPSKSPHALRAQLMNRALGDIEMAKAALARVQFSAAEACKLEDTSKTHTFRLIGILEDILDTIEIGKMELKELHDRLIEISVKKKAEEG